MPAPPPSPLYIGLGAGFCGSLTTLSSFARDLFLTLSGASPGQDVMALFAVAITTVCVCLAALRAGAQVALFIAWLLRRAGGRRRQKRHRQRLRLLRLLDRTAPILCTGLWVGAAVLTARPPSPSWRGLVLFSLVFAPAGCLLRFYVSTRLNAVRPAFPLGTFAVNVVGTAVLGVAWVLQHGGAVDCTGGGDGGCGSQIGCQVLQGVMDGFCGCLTTVSTWVMELSSLRRKHSYLYGAATIGTCFALLVIIMGSQKWAVGWTESVCAVN